MGLLRSRRLAVAALAIGLGAASVACSTGSGGKKGTLGASAGRGAPSTSTGGAAGGAAASGGTGTPTPSSVNGGTPAAGPGTTSAAPGGAGAAHPSGAPATTAKTAPKVTTPAATGPAPAAAGTYHYNGGGTQTVTAGTTTSPQAVPPQSTLTVAATGSGTEQWVSSSATTNLMFNSSGVFLKSESVPLVSTTCTFNSAVAYPPWPLGVGKTFSGQATCGSGSSATTLSLQGRVSGTASVSVGGTSVSTYLVQSTVTLSGTSLVIAETDWYAPSLRLPVKSTVLAQGGIPGFTVASNTTYVLASSSPS